MMPLYYSIDVLTADDLQHATRCWVAIVTSTAPTFLKLASNPGFAHDVCLTYFCDIFYQRLFDIHPKAQGLFMNAEGQGKFLVKMLALSLSEQQDPAAFQKALVKLAEVHNARGVKAVECKQSSHSALRLLTLASDGVIGEVLFWSLGTCLGPDAYTLEAHTAWVKIMSRMLSIMVPIAVTYEIFDGSAQQKRFQVQLNEE